MELQTIIIFLAPEEYILNFKSMQMHSQQTYDHDGVYCLTLVIEIIAADLSSIANTDYLPATQFFHS